ncbi:MAG: DUF3138 family protein [Rhodocyclaceae bacterium]|nr:DUF3138 family protein [Rhodocyclaceae bacterium]
MKMIGETLCRRHGRFKSIAWSCATAFLAMSHANARADTLAELKAQIEALQAKVAALESAQRDGGAGGTTDKYVTAGASKGSFRLPGSATSVKLGGYVKLDAIYNSRSAGANSAADQLLVPRAIPLDGSEDNEKGQLKLHARQTRINLGTHTPTSLGDLTTFIEFDFFGSDGNELATNSNNIRMRHAVGSLGSFTAGQTWSTFMDPASLPETLDFGGPVGEAFVRQALVRWTGKFDGGAWLLALENPDANFLRRNVDGSYGSLVADDDRMPDVVAKLELKSELGKYAVAVMARNLRVDAPATATAVAAKDSEWGGALGLYGTVPTFGKDVLQFSLIGGNAIGRYLGQAVFADADIDEQGQVHLNTQWGAILAYRHFWADALRSTVALSAARADHPDGAGAAVKEVASVHANLLWSPVPAATLGLELIRAELEREDGREGALNRLQASAQYAF